MITFHEKRVNFRKSLQEKDFLLAPGIYDALSAKIAERSRVLNALPWAVMQYLPLGLAHLI